MTIIAIIAIMAITIHSIIQVINPLYLHSWTCVCLALTSFKCWHFFFLSNFCLFLQERGKQAENAAVQARRSPRWSSITRHGEGTIGTVGRLVVIWLVDMCDALWFNWLIGVISCDSIGWSVWLTVIRLVDLSREVTELIDWLADSVDWLIF